MKARFAYIFCIFSITAYSNTCRGSIYSHTFAGCHWLPAAEGTISKNSYPYIVLLPYCEACDDQWWGGRCAGVCGGSRRGPPILNGVLWVGQSTQVSWRRPGHPDCSLQYQPLQRDPLWGTHCSKGSGSKYLHMLKTWIYICKLHFRIVGKSTRFKACDFCSLVKFTKIFTLWHVLPQTGQSKFWTKLLILNREILEGFRTKLQNFLTQICSSIQYSHTFAGCHWLPAAKVPLLKTATLAKCSCPTFRPVTHTLL